MKFLGKVYLLPDLNKAHRCPGWSGPGFVTGEKWNTGCQNGRIWVVPPSEEHRLDSILWDQHVRYVWDKPWSFGHCDECGVTTFPYALRWLYWRWLHHVLIWKTKIRLRDWWWEMQYDHGWGRFAQPTVLDVLQPKEDSEEGKT